MKNQKNKFLLSLVIGFLMFAGLGSVLAEDVAYITRGASYTDPFITQLLSEGGYTYDVIYQTALASTDFSDYSIILVGEGVFSNPSLIPVNQKNSVIMNSYHMEDWKWTSTSISTKASNYPSPIYVYDPESRVAYGIPSSFIPYNVDGVMISYRVKYISRFYKAPGLETIITDSSSFYSGSVVATINNGSELRGGAISNARGVFVGFTETNLLTEDAKAVFYNSIEWAMGGEDRDGDGFFMDLDCNDKDANINPDAEEIEYDGIDQDCDGKDLDDLDEDGFSSDIVGGEDCDDSDASVNPDAEDLTMNCRNDAPVIETIYRITVHESEIVELYVDAYDPEGDEFTYEINDSRFIQDLEDESYFTWQTDYEDEGDYSFFVITSDGELTSNKKFSVKVWNKNKAPELLMDIPEQEWEEDSTHALNLTQYFYDIDQDKLYYLFGESSDQEYIEIDRIENGVAYFESQKDWFGEDWITFRVTDGLNVAYTNNITLRVLPINDAQTLLEDIEVIEFDEDGIYELILNEFVYDPDSELEYSFENTSHITLQLSEDGNSILIVPQENWYGEEEAEIIINDEEFQVTETFLIKINSVNDAPDINEIENQFVLAGNLLSFSVSATDVEGEEFEFLINDSRFVQDYDTFEWQTTEQEFGYYTFLIGAYDGNNYGYKTVNVYVLQKVVINEIVWGSEGWIELYNPEEIPFSMANCSISNGNEELMLYGTLNNKGFAAFGWNALQENGYVELTCNNVFINRVEYQGFNEINSFARMPDGSEDWTILDYPTKGVSNSADVTKPEVELDSPVTDTLFTETREILFEFYVLDNMDENIECSVIANDKVLETSEFENNTLGSFYIDYLEDGVYYWNIECDDGSNTNKAEEDWMINISAPDMPVLSKIGNKITSENTELKFTISATDQDQDVLELYVEDLPEGASFTDNGNGKGTFIWKPNYNQSGSYNVKFFAEDETGLKDSEEITIIVGNAKEPPKFSDAETCDIKDNSIEISIKDPDQGDDFEIGETINGTIKIKNNFEEDMDFDVEIHLYDVEEEESIEDVQESVDIKDGKSEEIEFSIEIPSDVESEDFAIYVYVEGEDDECNSKYVEIKIERKKHEVVITDIILDREEAFPGEEIEVRVKAENLGRSDEDVFIILEIPSLNIYEKSEEIEIEKYGDKDKETEIFYVSIPQSASYGYYDLKATVIYDDEEENSKFADLIISAPRTSEQVEISTPIKLNTNVISISGSTTSGTSLELKETVSTSPKTPVVIKSSSSTTSSRNWRLFKSTNAINLGVEEKPAREYNPQLKVEFENKDNKKLLNADKWQWSLLAIVLGLVILIIIIMIIYLRKNTY